MQMQSESAFAITGEPLGSSSKSPLVEEKAELKLDSTLPGHKYDRQLIIIKWGLQTVAIMNAMLILVPAVDLLERTRHFAFNNERHEDVRIYVRATAALAIVVCATQVSITIYTLDGAFKIWCISHLIFAAMFASIASCAISSNFHRTTTAGFQLLYFVTVNGVFSLTAASILLFTALPKNSVVINV